VRRAGTVCVLLLSAPIAYLSSVDLRDYLVIYARLMHSTGCATHGMPRKNSGKGVDSSIDFYGARTTRYGQTAENERRNRADHGMHR